MTLTINKMSPILKYTTSIPVGKTAGEIQALLATHGANAVLMEYDQGGVIALSFKLATPQGEAGFRLPVNAQAILKVLERDGVERRYRTYEHAQRVAWRIIKDWVASQVALVEAEMVRMEEVFMPYLLVTPKQTLFERWESGQLRLGPGKEGN